MSSRAKSTAPDEDVLVRKRLWDGTTKKWSDWQVLLRRQDVRARSSRPRRSSRGQHAQQQVATTSFSLPLGGTFNVYPNLLSPERQEELTQELKQNERLFRQYRIQGTPEPRAHFLLHEKATSRAKSQPGYRYGAITMMAKPLSRLPKLGALAHELQATCRVEYWNIGVNPIYYRDSRDHMGFHADDDQGETKILTMLLKSPETPRCVVFQTAPIKVNGKKSTRRGDGFEQYELYVGAGDAYDMDGIMQKFYVHAVPPDKPGSERIAVVFRHGKFKMYTKDSGQPVEHLEPRAVIPKIIGQLACLVEGDSYSRSQLRELGGHSSAQRGISGNVKDGCDAIIVSGAREDKLGDDRLHTLLYAAETEVGAGSVLTSMKKQEPVRIFRSSALRNPYRALQDRLGPTQYRYDGLYTIQSVSYTGQDGTEKSETSTNVSRIVTGRLYKFHLQRVQVGDGDYFNRKSVFDLMIYARSNQTMEPRESLCPPSARTRPRRSQSLPSSRTRPSQSQSAPWATMDAPPRPPSSRKRKSTTFLNYGKRFRPRDK